VQTGGVIQNFLTREVVGKHKGPRRANNKCTEVPPPKIHMEGVDYEQGDLFDRFDCDCAFYRRISRDSLGPVYEGARYQDCRTVELTGSLKRQRHIPSARRHQTVYFETELRLL